MDLHVRAGRLCAGRDRHGPKRQPRRGCDRDGDLCNRSSCIRASDRQPRPAIQWRHPCPTRCASASPAGLIIRSALEVNPFLTISALAERIVETTLQRFNDFTNHVATPARLVRRTRCPAADTERSQHDFHCQRGKNGADGCSDIEGKATR